MSTMRILTPFPTLAEIAPELADDDEYEGGGELEPSVRRIAFTPDGKSLAIWTELGDNVCSIQWLDLERESITAEVETGEFALDGTPCAAPSLSADHRWVARVAYDRTAKAECIRLIDRAARKPIRYTLGWRVRHGGFYSFAVSPDGSFVAAGGRGPYSGSHNYSGIHCWDVAAALALPASRARQRIAPLERPALKLDDFIDEILFSPDSATLAAAHRGKAHWWDFPSGRLRGGFPRKDYRGEGGGGGLAFSPDGSRVALGGRVAVLVDVVGGDVLAELTHEPSLFDSARPAFHPSGKALVTAVGERVYLWDTTTGELLETAAPGLGTLRDVAVSPDGQTVAAAGYNSQIALWTPRWGKAVRRP